MPPTIEIEPARQPLQASIRPPGSKSITNRALVCAALADGESLLTGALVSDDTEVMIDSLRRLGIDVAVEDQGHTLRVSGGAGTFPASQAELFVGNSGTTIRFLAALATLGKGQYRLDGVARMRERPIGDLVATLRALGCDVRCEYDNGYPPLLVNAQGLPGGNATIAGNQSSQFLSGLLMAAPCAQGPLELRVEGELVSQPYVEMTLQVQREFGISIDADSQLTRFATPGQQHYQARQYAIEPDASAASYFWGAAAIAGGTVTVEGLSATSLQGDVAFVDVLEQMGCHVERQADSISVTGGPLRGVTVDMNAISDTVQTLAAVALFAEGPTEVSGVAHNRLKETDRISALATELRKLGAEVSERPDGLRIEPRPLRGTSVATYDDHRMAMSLALVGLRLSGVVVENPACTAKTYPDYFIDLQKVSQAPS